MPVRSEQRRDQPVGTARRHQEEDTRFVILADIPGVDPANIEIHMDRAS